MRLVKIGRHSWLVGLNWYVPPSEIGLEEIKKFVEEEGSDCISRRGNQIGHGNSEGNQRIIAKSRSLASWISIPHNSFIGIFHLTDQITGEPFWWGFARVNGNNVGGYGDTIYSSEEEARRSKDELLDLYPQNTSIDEIVICDTPEKSLAWLTPRCDMTLISRWRGDSEVIALSSMKSRRVDFTRRIVWTVLGVGILGVAGYFGMGVLNDLGVTAAAKQKAQQREMLRIRYEQNPEQLFTQDWQKFPSPHNSMAVCLAAVNKQMLNLAGWRMKSFDCSINSGKYNINMEYEHTPMANYEEIPARAKLGGKDSSAKNFRLSEQLTDKQTPVLGPHFHSLPAQENLRRTFLQIAQNFSVNVRFKFNKQAQKTVQDIGTFICPWTKGTFDINGVSSLKISGLGSILDSIPGLVVRTITFDMKTWGIKGEMYGL